MQRLGEKSRENGAARGACALAALILTGPAAFAAPDAAAPRGEVTVAASTISSRIDFEGFAPGAIVGSVYANDGVGPIGIQFTNPALPGTPNAAIIYDSSCAPGGLSTDCTGNDPDLGTPHTDYGGPGVGRGGAATSQYANANALGNVLIMANDMTDADGDGNVDDPNDGAFAWQPITIDFSAIGTVTPMSITILDAEAGYDIPFVELLNAQGLAVAGFDAPVVDDNGVVVLSLGQYSGVAKINVMLNGGGAIDDVTFSPDCTARVGDKLWRDDNGNGLQDDGEPGVPNVRLLLFLNTGVASETGEGMEFVTDTTTDAAGHYEFTGLCAGDYLIELDPTTLIPGLTDTIMNAGSDDEVDNDFGAGITAFNLLQNDTIDMSRDGGFAPPPGACCFADGSCLERTWIECESLGGQYQGDGTTCATGPCPEPTGACCFNGGSCNTIREATCLIAGGAWQGALTTCVSVVCPVNAACCFADGSCQTTTSTGCAASGGTWQNGTSCAAADCPQPGACCLDDGSCVDGLQPGACVASGGAWQGQNSTCAGTSCPQPTGACCLELGTCTTDTEAGCTAAGGTWQGQGVACAAVSCPQPTGACCFQSGTCNAITETICVNAGGTWQGALTVCATADCPQPGACCFDDGSCTTVQDAACTAAGGTWNGAGTDCPGAACPQPGACCLDDGTCTEGFETDCIAQNGTWQGDNTACATATCPQPGACCLDDGTCTEGFESDCIAQNGSWQGDNTACATTTCPQLCACCFDDGSCTLLFETDCTAQNGAWQGENTTCATASCPQPGACCLDDGSCTEGFETDCIAQNGTWQGDNTTCATATCPQLCACCFDDGSCTLLFETDCTAQNGAWQGENTTCATASCPQPGACCLGDGSCVEVFEADCLTQTGTWQGANSDCATADCPQLCACCFDDGSCTELFETECAAQNGVWQGAGTTCATILCPQPGACCLPNGTCTEVFENDCTAAGGTWQGANVSCNAVSCPQPGACCFPDATCTVVQPVVCAAQGGDYQGAAISCGGSLCTANTGPPSPGIGSATDKGSLVVFPKVEIRWDAAGNLLQDTFLELSNDFPEDVSVQAYFINGDAPTAAVLAPNGTLLERAHPGWNWIDNQFELTGNEPTHWSALTGMPKGMSPFTVLDPGMPPGRPDPEGGTDRVLRGYVIAWAVNTSGEEIRWNHLSGRGTVLSYFRGTAWEYNTMAFKVVDTAVPNGGLTGTPGTINLDGMEYSQAPTMLLMNFQAAGAFAWSNQGSGHIVISDTDLTLLPLGVDLRQETDGPITTKAHFDVWNENEVKFSGASQCVTCWDQRLLSSVGNPNHFFRTNLQTNHGKARIDGLRSQVCDLDFDLGDGLPLGADPRDVVSEDAPLLGVAARLLRINQDTRAAAGGNLVGMGAQSAVVRYDVLGLPPESADDDDAALRTQTDRFNGLFDALLRELNDRAGAEPGTLE